VGRPAIPSLFMILCTNPLHPTSPQSNLYGMKCYLGRPNVLRSGSCSVGPKERQRLGSALRVL
jgi:hypothetical protein